MPGDALPSSRAEWTILPDRPSGGLWRELWAYRELLGFLAWRDLQVRYKQTSLGLAWAVLQPLATVAAFTFVFGRLAGMPSGGLPYPLLVLSGQLVWQLFASGVSAAGMSLTGSAHLVSKVYFPRLLVPLAALAVAVVDVAVVLGVTLGATLIFTDGLSWRWLLLPAWLVVGLGLVVGTGLWLAALTARYRDLRHVLPFVLQVGIFITPVGFRSDLPVAWAAALALNPLTGVIAAVRWSLFGSADPFPLAALLGSAATGIALTWTGIAFFRRTEAEVVDVL